MNNQQQKATALHLPPNEVTDTCRIQTTAQLNTQPPSTSSCRSSSTGHPVLKPAGQCCTVWHRRPRQRCQEGRPCGWDSPSDPTRDSVCQTQEAPRHRRPSLENTGLQTPFPCNSLDRQGTTTEPSAHNGMQATGTTSNVHQRSPAITPLFVCRSGVKT